ncbi:aminoglycoside phosphotransferase family protein [Echinicola strongylocentroti]|uniref:Aminoglycoside phosphotransferase family protein n=1 Tax=Echinicola strongylocentroti TaxID=1795355 RepID=A0A2Z4IIY7_9BACT|nr:aminoglycoside phosphotransferase family protein [Echinicola strongylocentroti]AWW30914.1 aminoglycoside phosphotransferase family protein [Echinicola strongylocentroti]
MITDRITSKSIQLIIGQLLGNFGHDATDTTIRPYGSGHIHKTYLVDGPKQRFILQSFNQSVFPFPDRIAGNLQQVKDHLNEAELDFKLPLPMKTSAGTLFSDHGESFYRLFPFIDGACIDKAENSRQAYLAAKAFGGFIKACSVIEAGGLMEVIEGFHDLSLRYRQFENALKDTQVAMEGEVSEWVDFYKKQVLLVRKYRKYTDILPLRVTHNDTKINNVIYAQDFSKINAVIDLDTVMAGYVFYDFGDLVRTVACTEEEASTDWENIDVDLDKYAALLKGFGEALSGELTTEEKASLPFGGEMMACIMGLRFLTDYLNGNIYYPISYPEQNLHRAKNQGLLLRALQSKREEITALAEKELG